MGKTNAELADELLAKGDFKRRDHVRLLFDLAKVDKNVSLSKTARRYAEALARDGDELAYQMTGEMYHWAAPMDFDSYLVDVEWNRKPEAKFYLPRRAVLIKEVKCLQDLVDGNLDELFMSCPPRVGKLLADSTPVLTVNGWKNHGDLKVGDFVFSPEGKPVQVIAVHPKHHTTHTVTMSDGSRYKCHFRHEWQVYDRGRRAGKEPVILETQEMIGKLRPGVGNGNTHTHSRYTLPLIKPIEGVKRDLPVAPYSLGAWLGDGTNQKARINIAKEDFAIASAMMFEKYTGHKVYIHHQTDVLSIEFNDLREDLQKVGMCFSKKRTAKHIPDVYFAAPLEDRLQLLAGLLDTDGTLSRKEHRYHFSTTEEALRDDFITLISTFGWRCSVHMYEPKVSSSGVHGRLPVYSIGFNPTMEIPCRIERKRLTEFSKPRRLAIVSIEESEPEQGNCITVEGGMYCVGRRMTPTHNTSLLMFFMTWMLGRDPEATNLYCAYSDVITSAFYNGTLEVINDDVTYRWKEIFPNQYVAKTNAQLETVDINRAKHYPSLTCRSLYGTLNGACDVRNILIADDLIGGIEEALNPDRLASAWSKVENNMIPRAVGEKKKIVWVGTRWSLADPIGRRLALIQNSPEFAGYRYHVTNHPALNENDESNFHYKYGVGFTTEEYRRRRASFEANDDMASWFAQYMGEPIEREGTLFASGDLRYYNGVLPDETPVRIFMACDPAWGGGDYVSAPVGYKYENGDIYIHDVVFDNGEKTVTQPKIVDAVIRNHVGALQIEATKMTAGYAEDVEERLKQRGRKINLTTKPAPTTGQHKETRIFDKAPDIRQRLVFRDAAHRSKEYGMFMQNLFSFKLLGKNKHDDAPDSLAMLVDMDEVVSFKPRIIKALW